MVSTKLLLKTSRYGITAKIVAVAPMTLERSLGKARRVYDKRPKG